jgi:hypothetical protein
MSPSIGWPFVAPVLGGHAEIKLKGGTMFCPAAKVWWCGLIVVAFLFVSVPAVQADTVSLAIAGQNGFSAGADTLALQPSSMTLNPLTDGSVLTVPTQLVSWSVGNSGSLNQDFPFSISELVTIGGVSHPINIQGDLLITPTDDFLTFVQGAPIVFDDGTRSVIFTPLGSPAISASSFSTLFGDHTVPLSGSFQATLDVAPAPEPSALILVSMGATALLSMIRRRYSGGIEQ